MKKTLGQIAGILLDQSERIDRVGERIDELGERLAERRDHVIAVTLQERIDSAERLGPLPETSRVPSPR